MSLDFGRAAPQKMWSAALRWLVLALSIGPTIQTPIVSYPISCPPAQTSGPLPSAWEAMRVSPTPSSFHLSNDAEDGHVGIHVHHSTSASAEVCQLVPELNEHRGANTFGQHIVDVSHNDLLGLLAADWLPPIHLRHH